MAEDQSSEKTEDATPRRLREAREKGQVAKSRDLNTIVILIAAFVGIGAFMVFFAEQAQIAMTQAFAIVKQRNIEERDLFKHIVLAFSLIAKMSLPYLGVVGVIAFLVGFLQTGPVFSTEPLTMQWNRLNIVENVKNMAKITTLIELIKNILKVSLIFGIAYYVYRSRIGDILLSMTVSPEIGAKVGQSVILAFLLRIAIVFIALAVADMFVQRWQYAKQLRMSKDEVKREYKQDEGDPLIKSMRKQMHQELAQSDVRSAVGASDVIVTNPTELAIAIKYDDKNMAAPQIMAKGQRLFAQLIREVAQEQQIPIMRNVPLAWSLIELDVGDEIPEALYKAVAETLLIVYRLRDAGRADGETLQ